MQDLLRSIMVQYVVGFLLPMCGCVFVAGDWEAFFFIFIALGTPLPALIFCVMRDVRWIGLGMLTWCVLFFVGALTDNGHIIDFATASYLGRSLSEVRHRTAERRIATEAERQEEEAARQEASKPPWKKMSTSLPTAEPEDQELLAKLRSVMIEDGKEGLIREYPTLLKQHPEQLWLAYNYFVFAAREGDLNSVRAIAAHLSANDSAGTMANAVNSWLQAMEGAASKAEKDSLIDSLVPSDLQSRPIRYRSREELHARSLRRAAKEEEFKKLYRKVCNERSYEERFNSFQRPLNELKVHQGLKGLRKEYERLLESPPPYSLPLVESYAAFLIEDKRLAEANQFLKSQLATGRKEALILVMQQWLQESLDNNVPVEPLLDELYDDSDLQIIKDLWERCSSWTTGERVYDGERFFATWGQENSAHPIELAFDGRDDTYFKACPDFLGNGQVLFNAGRLTPVSKISLKFYRGEYGFGPPCRYSVSISANNDAWETIYKYDDGDCLSRNIALLEAPNVDLTVNGTKTQFVRLEYAMGGGCLGLTEFTVR